MTLPRLVVPLVLLSGCAFVGDDREAARLDPDGDGVLWPEDCDDQDAAVGEAPRGFLDQDGDGFGVGAERAVCPAAGAVAELGGDCDDGDADRRPDAQERCDGLDNNCDGAVDEGLVASYWPDADGDRFGDADGQPIEACTPPDGYAAQAGDCDDADPDRHPAAPEVCNAGVDDDCDGLADDADGDLEAASASVWYADEDGDGYGDVNAPVVGCLRPDGVVDNDLDCEDTSAAASPDVDTETCGDGLDNDCDGLDGLAEGCTPGPSASLADADRRFGSADIDDELGAALAGGADLNGDGDADLVLGAPGDDDAGSNAGRVCVLADPLSAAEDLSGCVTLTGTGPRDRLGAAVLALPDSGGDGYGALLVGAPDASAVAPAGGLAWLVQGPVSGTQAVDHVASAELSVAAAQARLGSALAAVGDQDGDGVAELLLGAPGWSEVALDAGAVWVVSGALRGSLDLESVGARLHAPDEDAEAGAAVASAGDTDGDGLDDVVVGAPRWLVSGAEQGAAVLVLGPVTAGLDLSDADAVLRGAGVGDRAGDAVAGGDLDGDGYADVAVGAPRSDAAVGDGGLVAVALGPLSSGSLDEADVRLQGEGLGDLAGSALAALADADRDGSVDLLVGAPGTSDGLSQQGAAWLLLTAEPGTHGLSADAAVWLGDAAQGRAGAVVASAGDVDGDGTTELLVGAPERPYGPYPDGAAWLVATGPGL